MPQPGEPVRPSAEDSFLDMLVETLAGLEESIRGPFLQRFFKTFTQIDLTEAQSLDAWSKILERQHEFSSALGRRVALKTALVDVLGATHFLRVPVVLEYDEFKKLQSYAATDALTGLYNRRLFNETFDRELTRSKRYNQPLAVVVFDLNHFKEVNDQYGHLTGDKVLELVSETFRRTLRASDFAFRIGGDEFTLLLPQTDPEQGAILSRRVRLNFENAVTGLGIKVPVALDFGLAVYPRDGETRETLFSVADRQFYAQRGSGTSRVIPMEPPAAARQAPRETPPAPAASLPPITTPPPAAASAAASAHAAPPKAPTHPRKWERVSLSGTKSYAIIDGSLKTATVIDLSYGGVALLFEKNDEIPAQFSAVLHVPILPPLRVSLRKAYANSAEGGRVRMGCAFVA